MRRSLCLGLVTVGVACSSGSQAFAGRWYLTDVVAGFQIWTGSDATGLKSTRFACQVK